jgi:hypothetical protein
MSQKKYQKLQAKNLEAAKRIYEHLKVYKVIDEKSFAALYFEVSISYTHKELPYDGSYANRVKTTKQFLEDHDLATFELINGIRVIAATQKCFRTKSFKNATKEIQMVSDVDIDKAINYVRMNNNLIPAEFEGPIVANILGLEGDHWKYFVKSYEYQAEGFPGYLDIKYKVIGPIHNLAGTGLVKIS